MLSKIKQKRGNKAYKRGITPLVATVLIIAFTVALAIIILAWSQSLVGSMKESTETAVNIQMACTTGISLNIENACISKSVVNGMAKDSLNVMLTNNGQEKVDKVKLRFFKNTADVGLDEVALAINPSGIEKYSSTAPGGKEYLSTETKMIEAIPIIKKEGKEIPCAGMIQKYGSLEGNYVETLC